MSPEHDPNAPASANENNVAENAGENPANAGSATHTETPMTTKYGSQGAATAAVRAPEPTAAAEPAAEARVDGTGVETPTTESAELEHAATSSISGDGAVGVVEPVVEGDPAFVSHAKSAAVAAADGEVVARTEEVHATSPAETGSAVVDPEVAHAAHEAAREAAESADAMESHETMEQLLEQFPTPEPVAAEGEIFDGRVVSVTDAGVVVDVGGKFEGLVPAQEFADSGSPIEFGPGQTIEVERLHESKDGYVLLSHVRAHRRRVWERIDKAYREHQTVKGKVTERIKGGLVVDIGVRSFLPASQIELRPVHDLDAWKDREIEVRVLKLNRKRGNVVVSRRAILEEEQKAKRSALVEALHEGSVVTGKVKNVTDYGVFVDLGGMDGLLHVSDLVWGRVPHPSTIVKAGDDLQVQVLKFDKEKQRISLGRKQLLPDPWSTVPERFPVGMKLTGKVVGVTDYGAFVQIEPGVEGLVHVSEMSWSKRTKHPSKVVKVGDEIEVVVLEVKTDQRRISLGLKQTQPDPWEAAAEKYPVGTIVHGKIRNLADFGAFVEIEEGMEGLIHISDVSWTERIKHPEREVQEGRQRRGQGVEGGLVEPAAFARHQAGEGHLERLVHGAQDRRCD